MSITKYVTPALVICLGGCASFAFDGSRPDYKPFVVSRDSTESSVLSATELVLTRLGGRAIEHQGHELRVVLNADPTMRDVVIVTVKDERIEIDYRTEVELDGSTWSRPRVTCASYSYARETALAAAIVQQAHSLTAGNARETPTIVALRASR